MCRIEFHAIPRLFDAIPHPYPASRAVPEWMKNLPMERGGGPTIKRCPPFLEAMTAGYIIPVPFDVGLTVSQEGLVSVQCQEMQMISAHFTAQYEDAGFDIAFTYLTSHDEAQSLIAEIARKKRRPLAILADLTQPQLAADQIHRAVAVEFGRLDVLVNNASLYLPADLRHTTSQMIH